MFAEEKRRNPTKVGRSLLRPNLQILEQRKTRINNRILQGKKMENLLIRRDRFHVTPMSADLFIHYLI